MKKIAKRLLKKNQALVTALEEADSKGQYRAVAALVTPQLCGKIAKAENVGFIKQRDLVWAIIDRFNGTDKKEAELDY